MPTGLELQEIDYSYHNLAQQFKNKQFPKLDIPSEGSYQLLLNDNQLATIEVEQLLAWFATFPPSVKELNLASNGFGRKDTTYCRALFNGLPKSIASLYLSADGYFYNMSANELKQVMQSIAATVHTLHFDRNMMFFTKENAAQFSDKLEAFSDNILPPTIKKLHLEVNYLKRIPLHELKKALSKLSSHLETVYLGGNEWLNSSFEELKECVESIPDNITNIFFQEYDIPEQTQKQLQAAFPHRIQFQCGENNFAVLFSMLKGFFVFSAIFSLFLLNEYLNHPVVPYVNTCAAALVGLYLTKNVFFKKETTEDNGQQQITLTKDEIAYKRE